MNTQELIEKVTEDGEMFVKEWSSLTTGNVIYIDHIYFKDDLCYEYTLFYTSHDNKWEHFNCDDGNLACLSKIISVRDYVSYEPINIDEFIAEHFAELL